MPQAVFDAYSSYYDLLYQDKDYAGEVRYIHEKLLQQQIARGEILEFGSGTGKHGRLLAELGYRVHGIERSPEMVAQARSTERFTCEQGDICTVHTGKRYDAVLSLFHVVSYQTDNSRVLDVFGRAHEHLREGGVFLFDFWYTPAVYSQRPAVRVKRMENQSLLVTRIAEPEIYPNENRVDVHYTIFASDKSSGHIETLKEVHPMRHFSLPEIDLFAKIAGFTRIGAEEFLTQEEPGTNTWGVCAVLKRI